MIDDLFRGIAEERRRQAGTSDRSQHHDPRLQMLGEVRITSSGVLFRRG